MGPNGASSRIDENYVLTLYYRLAFTPRKILHGATLKTTPPTTSLDINCVLSSAGIYTDSLPSSVQTSLTQRSLQRNNWNLLKMECPQTSRVLYGAKGTPDAGNFPATDRLARLVNQGFRGCKVFGSILNASAKCLAVVLTYVDARNVSDKHICPPRTSEMLGNPGGAHIRWVCTPNQFTHIQTFALHSPYLPIAIETPWNSRLVLFTALSKYLVSVHYVPGPKATL